MDEMPAGARLGKYELVVPIGHGPMCTVWRARADGGGDFAIKVLDPRYATDSDYVARFEAEARLAQSLSHPHIVRIHSIEAVSPAPHFVMDWLPGGNLARFRRTPLDQLGTVLSILHDICQALEYLHRQELFHCDVKASNVLLDADNRGYLADFGMTASAAELAESGSRGGTILYISPEQFASINDGPAAGPPVGARSDIYSLGVMMYELFAGEPAFTARNRFALMYQRGTSDPRPLTAVRPELPPAIDAIVLRAMARLPEGRFASAAELEQALVRLI